MKNLLPKIKTKTARIGIIGLGYTGLPLAIAFAKKFNVVGYDTNEKTVIYLLGSKSHILDVNDDMIKKYLNKSFYPTTNLKELEKCDFIMMVEKGLRKVGKKIRGQISLLWDWHTKRILMMRENRLR